MICSIVECEQTSDDYILHIRRQDGSIVKIQIPREDSQDTHARDCMVYKPDRIHGLNLVTEGHGT